jgi:predicted HTH transcriptional regulator
MTSEVVEPFPEAQFTNERVSFITDDIIVQRYVEIEGHLRKVVAVVKMRGSEHATDFRTYNLTATGAVLSESLSEYHGVTTGTPTFDGERQDDSHGLTKEEESLLDALIRLRSASAEKLVKQTGMSAKTVRQGIARLIALRFIDKDGAKGDTYRAVARPSGT